MSLAKFGRSVSSRLLGLVVAACDFDESALTITTHGFDFVALAQWLAGARIVGVGDK